MSLMRLIPQPPGKITGGEVLFGAGDDRKDLLKLSDDEIRQVRGNQIAMIFQDPMTSLNPVLTIGCQISEALMLHLGMDKAAARKRSVELLEMVGIPARDGSARRLSAPVLRRHAPARDDRHGAVLQPAAADRRRADHRAGRDHPGADRRPGQAAARRNRHGHHLDHARPGRGRRAGRPRDRDVCRLHRRRGAGQGALRQPAPSLHAGPARLAAAPGCSPRAPPDLHRGPAARSDRPAQGLPVLCPLLPIASSTARPKTPRWSRSAPATRSPAGWMYA